MRLATIVFYDVPLSKVLRRFMTRKEEKASFLTHYSGIGNMVHVKVVSTRRVLQKAQKKARALPGLPPPGKRVLVESSTISPI